MRNPFVHVVAGLLVAGVLAGPSAGPAADPASPVPADATAWTDSATTTDVIPSPPPPVCAEIERILDSGAVGARFEDHAEAQRYWSELRRFYYRREYRPAWRAAQGWRWGEVLGLMNALRHASSHGLDEARYPVDDIEPLVSSVGRTTAPDIARTDLYLSYVFLTYAGHLSRGRVDADSIRVHWHIHDDSPDPVGALERAADGYGVSRALREMAPRHEAYVQLRRALLHYRGVAASGGWPEVVGTFKIKRGDRSPDAGAVRAHLLATGDLVPAFPAPAGGDSASWLFDDELDEAVRRYQARLGLAVDGVVGRETLANMNVTVGDRLHTIAWNMERWRWFPDTLETRLVLVNIPAFELDVLEADRQVLAMRVVTGTEETATPSFHDRIRYLETRPYWNVPRKIASEEILPKVLEDPEYLAGRDFVLFDRSTGNRVSADSVEWTTMHPDSIPYLFRQQPGPLNPLGSIKFMFPNRFAIYLHDTSNPRLFQRHMRDFSHGCIRIEKPVELAEYLLREDPAWDRESIEAAMAGPKTKRIDLAKPMPIYLVYLTAFIDPAGVLNFRRDLYGRDEVMRVCLADYDPGWLTPEGFLARTGSP